MDPIDLIRQNRIKRYFRTTRKLNVPNMIFHITQRAAGKEPLFLEDDDYMIMLGLLKEIAQSYSLDVFSFCFMPNHIHLLFSPRKANLYDAMRDLFSRYAMRFNKKYERKGHLFGGPYRQAVCFDDTYLLAISLYIHLNPVKAGLISDPLNYRWSSYRLYGEDNASESFVNPGLILGLLAKDKLKSRESYRHLMKRGMDEQIDHVLESEDAIERFHQKLASLFPSVFKKASEKKKIKEYSGIDLLNLEDFDKKIDEIKSGLFPDPPSSRKAKKFLIEQLIARGYKRSEIAEKMDVSIKTVYNIMRSHL